MARRKTSRQVRREAEARRGRGRTTRRPATRAPDRRGRRGVSNRVTSGLSREDRAALNAAEGRAAQELANDPSAQELYDNMLKLSTLSPGEREKVMEHLRDVAEENLSPFFDAERQEVLTDVRFAMKTIAQKFGQFNEETQREFDQALDRLTMDSANQLRDTLVSVNQRSLLSSGMMNILARRIIDDEEFSAGQFKEDLDDDLRFSAEKQGLAEEGVGIDRDKANRQIGLQEDEAIEAQATREAGRLELEEILTAINDGVADIDPSTGDFRFKPQEETTRVERTSLDSVVGQSRSIQTRQAQTTAGQRLQSNAERRRQSRLNNRRTTTTSTQRRTTRRVATTTAGKRLQSNADRRRAERLRNRRL